MTKKALVDGRKGLLSAEFNSSPFRVACEVGNLRIIEFFLQQGMNLESRSPRGVTPLMVACMHGHQKLAKNLIARGAEISAYTDNGTTVAMCASIGRLDDFAMSLLDLGVEAFPSYPQHQSSLNLALLFSQKRLAERLISEAQAKGEEFLSQSINKACSRGHTPFLTACHSGLEDIALRLIDMGADLSATNNRGENALFLTCTNQHHDCSRLAQGLIAAGLDPSWQNEWGIFCFRQACIYHHRNTMRVLLKAGACRHLTRTESWFKLCGEPIQKYLRNC